MPIDAQNADAGFRVLIMGSTLRAIEAPQLECVHMCVLVSIKSMRSRKGADAGLGRSMPDVRCPMFDVLGRPRCGGVGACVLGRLRQTRPRDVLRRTLLKVL